MKQLVFLALCAAAVVLWLQNIDDQTRVHFLDIGQGDAILLDMPRNKQILVDGGPDDSILEELRLTMPLGDETIETVILSHADKDHIQGLFSVTEAYQIEQVIIGRSQDHARLLRNWLRLLKTKQVPVRRVQGEQNINLHGGQIRFFPVIDETLDRNEASLVFTFSKGEIDILFSGDIEEDREAEFVEHYPDVLESEILKIPHHGSRTSSGMDFVRRVDPGLGVMQLGADNSYGHPHSRTLYTYKKLSIPVYRTDKHGRVSFAFDEHRIWRIRPRFALFGHPFGKFERNVYTVQEEKDI